MLRGLFSWVSRGFIAFLLFLVLMLWASNYIETPFILLWLAVVVIWVRIEAKR